MPQKIEHIKDMKPIGIYIHVPFCRAKCPYCDFYSVGVSESLLNRYTDETVRRIRALKDMKITADTVYFGGGTPSLLGGERIVRIMSALDECIYISHGAEITVESNPNADLLEFLSGCSATGVNRVSLGMQSAVPRELAAIGRKHSPDDVLRAIECAHMLGIYNISLDLMLGIPFQTEESLAASLEFIKNCAPSHVSAYMLKIEDGTAFYRIKDSLPIADDDALADLYIAAFDGLEQIGFRQYEISNAACSGFVGRHNLKYWNCEEYIGIGPAAHGFFMGKRYFFDRSLNDYLDGNEPELDCIGGDMEEYIMLRLRLNEGLTEQGMNERFGCGIPPSIRAMAGASQFGEFCVCDSEHIALTRKGMLLSNTLIGRFIDLL